MKVIVIGGVAAGPKVASRINRLNGDAEVTIIEKGEFLSYAGCGLPYYISGKVQTQEELRSTPVGTVRDSVFFSKVKNVRVKNHTEATRIDREKKEVEVRSLESGEKQILPYDKLVLATGARNIKPEIPGIHLKNVFGLKGIEDAEAIKAKLAQHKALDTVIVGGGLIGVEVAEAFAEMGCRVTIVEFQPQILSIMDPDMIQHVEQHFEANGVKIRTSTRVTAFEGDNEVRRVITDQGEIAADLVIMAVGVKPESRLAETAGIKLGKTGAIHVNSQMQTSDENIYAVGDCAEKRNLITGEPSYVPLGSTANKEGRVAANALMGMEDQFQGILGSAVCKVFQFTVARTGLSEKEARSAGYDAITTLCPSPDKPHFMPTAKLLLLKIIADSKTGKILGGQAAGPGAGDKRMDIIATAITGGLTLEQLSNLDLCYAPPYAPALDNVITAANILRNKRDGLLQGITAQELAAIGTPGKDFTFLDARSPAEVQEVALPGAVNIPLGAVRTRLEELDKNLPVVAFCKISLRGYEAALILKKAGFKDVKVLDGGVVMWPFEKIVGN
jgi:NADPH-dependent 2,4-dienoyl-CoA reductase/sulfur reductase-like enzyme/rhodanese-related sulfurtransferase